MNIMHRYTLEKGSKKHYCPRCNRKRFVRYVDTETGNYLPKVYGRCDREVSCTYHFNPYTDGYGRESKGRSLFVSKYSTTWRPKEVIRTVQRNEELVYFDFETFRKTLGNYEQNVFIQNLLHAVPFPFGIQEVERVIELYRLGTITKGYRSGGVTFPFIDRNGNVRAIQVKTFDEKNHTTGTDFLHSIIQKDLEREGTASPPWLEPYCKQEKKVSCLFGEHLLSKYPGNPVALVEAPKTAIYGTLYLGYPRTSEDLIWLAVYNKSSLTFDRVKVLKGRTVLVFPDLSADGQTFREWETKAKGFGGKLSGTRFKVSNLIEQASPIEDKYDGLDLGDYLIKRDWRSFRMPRGDSAPSTAEQFSNPTVLSSIPEETAGKFADWKTRVKWSSEILDLERFFSERTISTEELKLSDSITISDCSGFVQQQLTMAITHLGDEAYLPYLQRLHVLKDALTIKQL
jgi:hypothetical protein